MLRSLYKMMWYLLMTYPHPLVYFKSSLHYFKYLIPCKCYVSSCQCMANSDLLFGAFWNFFPNIFDTGLVESKDLELADLEGCLCHKWRGLTTDICCFRVLEAQSPRLKRWQAWFPLWGRICSALAPSLCWLAGNLWHHWLVEASSQSVFIFPWCPPCVCLLLQFPF